MPLPTDSTHLSDEDASLLLDRYAGEVEGKFAAASMMRAMANVRTVKGTDTIVNRRIGGTTLKKLVAGVRPDASPRAQGKVSLTIDTVIMARDNQSLLNKEQQDFDLMAEIGEDHGKYIGEFFDAAFLLQAVKGSQLAAPVKQGSQSTDANLQKNFKAGHNATLGASGDERDGDRVYDAVVSIVEEMEEQRIPTSELIMAVRPKVYTGLANSDRLVNSDVAPGNGNSGTRMVQTCAGIRIWKTPLIPNVAHTGAAEDIGTLLGANYQVSATDAKAQVVILHPRSLLAGETIPLSSDLFFSKEEKQWFIDSWLAFGVTPNRPDLCAAVFAA